MDEEVEIKCEYEKGVEIMEGRVLERKDNSIIVFTSYCFIEFIEYYDLPWKTKPIIYVDGILIKEYNRLPYQNRFNDLDEDGEMGVCLFPKAKFEFFF